MFYWLELRLICLVYLLVEGFVFWLMVRRCKSIRIFVVLGCMLSEDVFFGVLILRLSCVNGSNVLFIVLIEGLLWYFGFYYRVK